MCYRMSYVMGYRLTKSELKLHVADIGDPDVMCLLMACNVCLRCRWEIVHSSNLQCPKPPNIGANFAF